MLEFARWKVWAVWAIIAAGIVLSIPSILSEEQLESYPDFLPQSRISLGLDLAGGSYLLLEADEGDLAKQRLTAQEENVQTELRGDPRVRIGDVSTADGRLSFMVRDPAQLDEAVERLRAMTQPVGLTGQRDWNVSVEDSTRIVLTPTAEGELRAIEDAVTVARDVVRRRIDPSGTREVTVRTQGSNRVLVQVPGVEDPEALKALIGRTARLEFKLVDLEANPAQLNAGRAPVGSEIAPYPDAPLGLPFVGYSTADGVPVIALKRRVIVSGDQLANAQQSFDQDGNPVVSLTFNSQGARRFGRVTQENVQKPFAMLLDGAVLSAPNINEPILGGQAQISGNFTVDSANDLAIALSSGKLPVKLDVVEERTVSADLGKDSIEKGAVAALVATLAVLLYMLATYGRFGVYANMALIINAFMILAAMAVFNATLTLPGIAGFVLTIGAAVDANVLINERIREELRRGRKVLDAIKHGYDEASTAIFDANITNTIAAAIMFYFGSGPIRGFAVVLLIGIVTSVWTAVTFTRMMVTLWVRKARPKTIAV
ncbi:protein translocase subunit SecD [Sphingomicrobium astaxanthinifaciens]|uniref:protein translocase subunit SecD n=1 Tax=Sphingomicrobium astaxanthinifaciens TaxID=1227949 RepID=UPI001FCC455B|nr:protein translocase subunit SecD [Sphingomicrobium astaxanthinifaciens]MCJ7421494.1 protein translocase subunit SecD [Sphingomicrobium astaxanthinifaciens]